MKREEKRKIPLIAWWWPVMGKYLQAEEVYYRAVSVVLSHFIFFFLFVCLLVFSKQEFKGIVIMQRTVNQLLLLLLLLLLFPYCHVLQINRGFPAGSHFLTVRSMEVVRKADRKLMFIPVVFILLRIWGTIRFFRVWVYYPSKPSSIEWLILLHVSTLWFLKYLFVYK